MHAGMVNTTGGLSSRSLRINIIIHKMLCDQESNIYPAGKNSVKPFFQEPGNGFLHPFLHIPGHRAQ
jgi:hypothetical protein